MHRPWIFEGMPNDQRHLTKQDYARRLAYKLRVLRAKRGLSQEQVAERAGIATFTYQKFEKGISSKGKPMNPRLDTLVDLASAFEIDASDLIRVDYDALEPLLSDEDLARGQGRQEDEP